MSVLPRRSNDVVDGSFAMGGTDGGGALQKRLLGALLSRWVRWAVGGAAVAAMLVGVAEVATPIASDDLVQSEAATRMVDIGRAVRADIARVVRPAIERTGKLAADPRVIEAMNSGDASKREAVCNDAVRDATEIDAFALFDDEGRIVAINTRYASGELIPPERVRRIMGLSFDDREIIQQCVRNEAATAELEFQTKCDITPAMFDSSGLSVAYSVPVRDPKTGQRIGVASARLRFERVTSVLESSGLGDPAGSIEFVTDRGAYFSEEINSGRAVPPIPVETLAKVVAPLIGDQGDYSFTRQGRNFLGIVRLKDFETLEGGGIQVLVVASEAWVTGAMRQQRMLVAGLWLVGAVALVLVSVLLRGATALRIAGEAALAERNVATEALSELAAHKAALDEHAIVTVTDADGLLVNANEAMCRISGYEERELVGTRIDFRGSPRHDAEFWRGMWESMRAGRTWHGEVCALTKDGEEYWVETTVVPFRDGEGRIAKYVLIRSDITQRKLTEVERERANKAEAASHAKSDFLAHMSHEIRTPLNGVVGMLDLLLGAGLAREQRRYGELAKNSAALLTSVLGDILDLSKIEAGKLELSPSDFNLHIAVEEVMAMLAQSASSKSLETACHIEAGVPVVVHADAERLRQVLVNLVNNAIKFTRQGTIVLRVSADSRSGDSAVLRFTVTDTGIGIPRERMSRLFKAFSQADASTTREFGGTGLGLAISRQIVDLMCGKIGVESEVGRGSTFWFTVTVSARSAAPADLARGPVRRETMRALVVEDNEVQRGIMLEQLSAWGFAAEGVEGGEEALRILAAGLERGEPFGLAIIDLVMPGMDGFEVAMAIRADRRMRELALMAILPTEGDLDAPRLSDMGFGGAMTKPVRQSQLFDTIMDTVAASRTAPLPMTETEGAILGRDGVEPPPRREGLQVLVAEDNEVNQIVVSEVLKKLGHRYTVVGDGLQAVREVEAGAYDVVLMDCQMPVMDGFEATREIRNRERAGLPSPRSGRHMPIVALTANAMKGDRERCLQAGMDGYTTKPISPPDLCRVIDEVLAAESSTARAA